MGIRRIGLLVSLLAMFGLGGCAKSTERQMQQYLEFYYPSTGEFTYEIGFDWGSYGIDTMAKAAEGVSADSARYRGYIVARPSVAQDDKGNPLWTYLVTPEGEVWVRHDDGSIPAAGHREEVRRSEDASGVTTITTVIESPAEPVIDDFLAKPAGWTRYGRLVAVGKKYRLERVSGS